MVHHGVVGDRHVRFAREVVLQRAPNFLSYEVLIDLKPDLVVVDVVVITQVVDLDFSVMVLSKVLDDVSDRVPIQAFDTFSWEAHSENFLGDLSHIEVEVFILIPLTVLGDHLLDVGVLVRALLRFSLVDVLVNAVVFFLREVVYSGEVYRFCI